MVVYIYLIRLELRKMLTYRFEFWIELLVGITLKCTVVYFLWTTLFKTLDTPYLKGIPFKLMLTYVILTVSMKEMIIGKSVGVLSDDIYQGSLNKYLIYPSSFVFQKLASHLARSFFYFLQLPIFFGFITYFFDHSLDWSKIIFAFFPVLLGACLYFMMNAILELCAFKWDSVWSLSVGLRFVSNFLGGISVPLILFPNPYQEYLRFLPFYFCAGYPVEILTSFHSGLPASTTNSVFLMFGVGVLWFGFFTFAFHKLYHRCLKSYSGIGI